MKKENTILLIKNGDDAAFSNLLKMHHNMIYKIIYGMKLNHGDYQVDVDSLFQEGSLALYDAVFSYEEDNDACFSSYAYMVIRARIRTYVRDHYRYLKNECLSIDNDDNIHYEIYAQNNFVCENPIAYYQNKEFEEHLNKFLKTLSKEDQEIFKLRSEHCTYKQISKRLNINTKRVDNRLRVLRKRLSDYLKNV